jgi:hypothetical protein
MMSGVQLWCWVTIVGSEGTELASFALRGSGAPDLLVVDNLAHLALQAGRLGGQVVLTEVSPALRGLVWLVGLPVEVQGEAELGKEPCGVQEGQEEGHPGDLPS